MLSSALSPSSSIGEPVTSSSFNRAKPLSGSSVVMLVHSQVQGFQLPQPRKAHQSLVRDTFARESEPLQAGQAGKRAQVVITARQLGQQERLERGQFLEVHQRIAADRAVREVKVLQPGEMPDMDHRRVECLHSGEVHSDHSPAEIWAEPLDDPVGPRARCRPRCRLAVAPLPVIRDTAASSFDRLHGIALTGDLSFPASIQNNDPKRHDHNRPRDLAPSPPQTQRQQKTTPSRTMQNVGKCRANPESAGERARCRPTLSVPSRKPSLAGAPRSAAHAASGCRKPEPADSSVWLVTGATPRRQSRRERSPGVAAAASRTRRSS